MWTIFSHEKKILCVGRNHIFQVDFLRKFANKFFFKKNTGETPEKTRAEC